MPQGPGILRVYRARVKPGREEEWERLHGDHADGRLAGIDGLLRWFRGKPLDAEGNEWVFVTLWRDKDALRAFAGASAGVVLLGAERDLADSMTVDLYELT